MIGIIYKDIDLNFGQQITKDVAKKLNENAVSQSVKNVVLSKGKLFQPKFGSGLYSSLFEGNDPIIRNIMKDQIRSAIKINEKRINNLKIDFFGEIDQNQLGINIYYKMKDVKELFEVSIIIDQIK